MKSNSDYLLFLMPLIVCFLTPIFTLASNSIPEEYINPEIKVESHLGSTEMPFYEIRLLELMNNGNDYFVKFFGVFDATDCGFAKPDEFTILKKWLSAKEIQIIPVAKYQTGKSAEIFKICPFLETPHFISGNIYLGSDIPTGDESVTLIFKNKSNQIVKAIELKYSSGVWSLVR